MTKDEREELLPCPFCGGKGREIYYKTKGTKKIYKPKKNYPEKLKARALLNHAINAGRIVRPNLCNQCRKIGRIQAHHPYYSKPLDVEWLCNPCHSLKHHPLPEGAIS